MSHVNIDIVQGWTGAIDLQLLTDGAPYALSTGETLAAVGYDKHGAAVDFIGDLTTVTASSGAVRLLPDAGDFVASLSPYRLRIKVTNGGLDVFFPNGEPFTVSVRE